MDDLSQNSSESTEGNSPFSGLAKAIKQAGGFSASSFGNGAFSNAISELAKMPEPDYPYLTDASPTDYLLKPDWNQLIIIGNGFDLECGLHSTYRDFFAPRRKILLCETTPGKRSEQSWDECLKETGISAWELILQDKYKSYWYDVERAIKDWVAWDYAGIGFPSKNIAIVLQYIKSGAKSDQADPDRLVGAKVARYIEDTHPAADIRGWEAEDVYDFLLEELHALEHEFASYLKGEIARSNDYKQNAIRLMGNLLNDEFPKDSDEYEIEESVLSFNYTRPFGSQLGRAPRTNILSNVHGSIEKDNIVFGIDGSDCMGLNKVIEFTKTYRLMALGSPDFSRVVHGDGKSPMSHSTDLIKFYGHSLADSDYSYFQAIFDTVGLYSGNTRLVFYYRPHKLRDGSMRSEKDVRESTMKSAIKLLTAYGRTMENADHGKNLIHKLLLEGRLSVKLLPDNEVVPKG